MEPSSSGLSVKDCVAKFRKSENRVWLAHRAKVHSVVWNRDGTKLASGSVDKTARVWDVTPDFYKHPVPNSQLLEGHMSAVEQLCWDATSVSHVATACCDKTVRIWDIRQPNPLVVTINTIGENINISWCPDGNYIAVGNKNDIITIIDARKFKATKIQQFFHEVNEFTWDPQGRHLYMTTELGTVEIFTADLRRVRSVHAHPSNIYCIRFAPPGKLQQQAFAVGSADAIVSLFTLPELICVRTFNRLEFPIRTLSFSWDASMIASASEETFVDVSHVSTGETVFTVKTTAALSSVAWHPSEFVLAYAAEEKDPRTDREEGNIRLVRCV